MAHTLSRRNKPYFMTNTPPELVIIGHSNAVNALAFSADGKTLVSSACDQTAIVWDVQTGQMRRLFHLIGVGNSLLLTPDGTLLVTDDGRVWDMLTGKLLWKRNRYMVPLACSPDGRILAYATFVWKGTGTHVLLTDIRTGRIRHRFPCGENLPDSLAFSSDGELVAVSGDDSRREGEASTYVTTVFNLRTGEIRQLLHGRSVFLFGVNLGPEVRLVAVSPGGEQLWNAETGVVLKTFEEPQPNLRAGYDMSISLCPNERLMAVGTRQGEVRVYNVDTLECLWQKEAHQSWTRAMAFTYDGQRLATSGDDGTIRLWNAATGELLQVLGRPAMSMEAVAFSPDGETITALGEDGTARLWGLNTRCCERQEADTPGVLRLGAPKNPDTARNLWTIAPPLLPQSREHCFPPRIAAVSPDGSLAAVSGYARGSHSLSIWNLSTQTVQSTLRKTRIPRDIFTFSPDNRLLAIGSGTKQIRLYDTQSGSLVRKWTITLEGIWPLTELRFSPDGRTLASGDAAFTILLWDVETGRLKRRLYPQREGVCTLAFSPNGKTLAVGAAYSKVGWLKSLGRGGKQRFLVGHTANMYSVDFSPDGTQIATGASDGTTRLWEAESGKLLMTFLALPGEDWVIYTPEGDYTCSAGAEQYLLWRDGEDLVSVVQGKPGERTA